MNNYTNHYIALYCAKETHEFLSRIIDTCTLNNQLKIFQEKNAEMILAISHFFRYKEKAIDEVIDKVADLHIALGQFLIIFSQFDEKLQERIRINLDKLSQDVKGQSLSDNN